jgi:hypothetical protein
MRLRSVISKLSVVLLLGLVSSPALAQAAGVATTVLNELQALAGPAITLAVVWMGVLIMTKRMSVVSFLVLCVGIAIVVSGGLL